MLHGRASTGDHARQLPHQIEVVGQERVEVRFTQLEKPRIRNGCRRCRPRTSAQQSHFPDNFARAEKRQHSFTTGGLACRDPYSTIDHDVHRFDRITLPEQYLIATDPSFSEEFANLAEV